MTRLQILRKEKSLTQVALADLMHISQSTVSSWENGLYEPDRESLFWLANYYGVSTDYILGYSADRGQAPQSLDYLREYLLSKGLRFNLEELEKLDAIITGITELMQ